MGTHVPTNSSLNFNTTKFTFQHLSFSDYFGPRDATEYLRKKPIRSDWRSQSCRRLLKPIADIKRLKASLSCELKMAANGKKIVGLNSRLIWVFQIVLPRHYSTRTLEPNLISLTCICKWTEHYVLIVLFYVTC